MKAKKDEMMQKYGRLDWGPVKNDNKRNAEEGKRYEGFPILMNLQSGGILTCDVIEVSEKGFLVKPLSISGFDDSDSESDVDFNDFIPYDKFFHVFLRA